MATWQQSDHRVDKGDRMDIAEAISKVAQLAEGKRKRVEFVDLPDGKYKVDQDTGEIEKVYLTTATRSKASLANIDSLIVWASTMNDPDEQGDIVIGRFGPTRARFPAIDLPCDQSHAEVVFFDGFIPKPKMNAREFIAWLDLVRPGLDPKDAVVIDKCMSSITTGTSASQTVVQNGAAIVVKTEATRGQMAPADPFPKRITIKAPFGDPSFVTPLTFSMTLESTEKNDLVVYAVLDEMELVDGAVTGPRIRYVEWAVEKLKVLNPGVGVVPVAGEPGVQPTWAVMVGA